MTTDTALIEGLAREGREVLAKTLKPRDRFALVDFPNHTNVGDSAIWLGELAALEDLGLGAPVYVCDLETYSARELRRRTEGGTILIHGGGNLGDLWPRHQEFRERVVAEHRDCPIVQLPQSVRFSEPAALERARRVFGDHPDLTLLVRDRASLDRARAEFDTPSAPCPDLALCLPLRSRPQAPARELQWLLREDVEAAGHRDGELPGGAVPVDWLEELPGGAARRARRLGSLLAGAGAPGRRAAPILWRLWHAAARERLERGMQVLSEGEVVVTDRLHAHILCLLLSIPHVVLPDRHGKIEPFLETWTGTSDLVVFAPDVQAAAEAARGLRSRHPGAGEKRAS